MTSLNLTTIPIIGQILLGARNLGAAGRRRRGSVDTGEALIYLLIAAGVIALVCVVLYVSNRIVHHRRFNSHGSLFKGLCQIHGLNHGARALLKQVAGQHKLAYASQVFTDPQWLDPASLRGSLRRHAAEVNSLRNRLFATGGN